MCLQSDEELILKYQSLGDIDALNQLVNRYLEKTYAFFLSQLNNRSDVDDLVQNVFLKIVRKINTGAGINRFENYLFTACKNTLRDFFKVKESGTLFENPGSMDVSNSVNHISLLNWEKAEASISLTELQWHIKECINGFFSEKVRNILWDYMNGYTLKEIACRNECPAGTAGSIWHRNKKKLLECVLKRIGEV